MHYSATKILGVIPLLMSKINALFCYKEIKTMPEKGPLW